jgi:hypothetical protein
MAELFRLFGFTIGTANNVASITKEIPKEERSPITPSNDDGAVTITTTPYYGTYVDLEGSVKNEIELITKYRHMSLQRELNSAISEIVNEVVQKDEDGEIVELDLDDLKVSDGTKEKILEEYENIQKLLSWNTIPDEIFRRWYIDGRIYYHVIVNEKIPQEGIKELRYVDPRRIRKVREIQKRKDPVTGADIVDKINEYYLYSEKVHMATTITTNIGVKITPDAIINVNSSLMDEKGIMVLSHLHQAIRPLNHLRMVEDAMVIYYLSRAPERRIFYIDVGNMEKRKADQYLYDIMMKYRNKLVYDSTTGEIRDDRKHLSMMEDFWIPRRGEGKSTEITTLQGGVNLAQLGESTEYFKKALYESLNIPISRLNLDGQGPSLVGIGRSTEVSREEIKFSKFIDTIRGKFQNIFLNSLGLQLRLKNICNEEEWKVLKQDIKFKWNKSNNFDELLEAELLRERVTTLSLIDPYVGRFFSAEWVQKNVLQMNEEEIVEMKMQIEKEMKEGNPATTGSMGVLQQAQADAQLQQQDAVNQYLDAMPAPDAQTAPLIMAPMLTGQPFTGKLDPNLQAKAAMQNPGMGGMGGAPTPDAMNSPGPGGPMGNQGMGGSGMKPPMGGSGAAGGGAGKVQKPAAAPKNKAAASGNRMKGKLS